MIESVLESNLESTLESTPKNSHHPFINKNKTPQVSKKILNIVGRTNAKYNLIENGDRILLGLSGGKDSMLLARILAHIKQHAPFKFEYHAMTIDYGRGGEYEYIFEYCDFFRIPYTLNRTEIFKILENHKKQGSIYCSFCSRMRRGELYQIALQQGFNKVALAHHLDDAAESFFMNLTYNGSLRSMPPKYRAENGLQVIRPLIFVRERQIIDYIASNGIYIAPDCNCPINWLPEDKRPRAREETKALLKDLEGKNPLLFKSLKNAFNNIHANSFCDEKYLDK
ncbi:tRNA 2-thiocytidine biosynthesis protein TtcA [Helicobacter saguini]|uniref:tRNA 2-thiocytidine biosynthesis protein TtcA n=1 Tax=Helicobacter saguini TaxID=1548018 RepID=A0A347VPE4_9HELI|nr:ATP-binding protein [Helicobacter saguini]MWV61398.1 tRNA 2-thiocytidine biosynthesis protein TtcA [Helicobacter saguini]MWV67934.1 tRNA 2-thiocytidine biosynthesis protein TtcA [Helicobacter saguini]MWV70599.1 tRNA 2-thiocytidine biosynthesis protein TtcA [Helicobacter saguini]MWV72503.1 tRNA 2-thiocytidine biosynthesis protein TtcA [Helicobacter saguini]TLD94752.1 tRNA 2-thiocytidine biosynthesis protein TtcA [Helicobacter saguini]